MGPNQPCEDYRSNPVLGLFRNAKTPAFTALFFIAEAAAEGDHTVFRCNGHVYRP